MKPNSKYLKNTEQLAELGGWCEGIHELGDPCCYVRDEDGLEAFAREMQWKDVAELCNELGAEPVDLIGKIFTICSGRLYVWGDSDRMAVLGATDVELVDFWPEQA
jgi:hypothetical protein